MLAPILPRPTMPIFIVSFLPCCSVPARYSSALSDDLAQIVELDADHPPPMRQEALVIADRLSADQGREVIGLSGDGNLPRRRRADQLDRDDAVRTALVELPGRVQESRPVAGRYGHSLV